MMLFIPSVSIQEYGSYVSTDLISRLLKDRVILLTKTIDDDVASLIVSQLLHLEADNQKDISIYINSPGGSVTAALAIYDIMQYIQSRVTTICFGQACSAASFLFCAGERRLLTRHARILIHQPLGGAKGQADDLKIYVDEIMRLKDLIIYVYETHTKMKRATVRSLISRDYIMTADEAIAKGIADEIVQNKRNKVKYPPNCKLKGLKR